MNEFSINPEENETIDYQAEIVRLDAILAAMPDIIDKDPEKIDEKMQLQEQICSAKLKHFESLDETERVEMVKDYIQDPEHGETYLELIEMGIPVEPETVWEDIFGQSTPTLTDSIRALIEHELDKLIGE